MVVLICIHAYTIGIITIGDIGSMLRKLITLMAVSIVAATSAIPASAASLLNGQEHYYTVQFRSDSKATVYAKLAFQNGQSDKDRDTYTFSLPSGVSADSLSIQQIIAKKTEVSTCNPKIVIGSSTATQNCPVTTTGYDDDFDFFSNNNNYGYYYDYYYPESRYDDKYEYTDVTPSVNGQTYTVKLPRAIKPHKQGAVLVTFVSTNYVTSAFGGRFNYDFRTLMTDEMIDDASVAINFDEELYSRDVDQKRTSGATAANSIKSGADMSASYESKRIDSLIPTIGNGGEYNRTQTKMLPGDVLGVKGTYATNPTLLFLNEILVGIAITVAAAAALWFGFKHYRKTHPRKSHSDTSAAIHPKYNDDAETASIKHLLAVSGASTLATVVALLVLTGLVAIANNGSSDLIPYILSLFTIVVVGTTAVFAPIAYILRFGVRSLLRWLLINAALIAILCFVAIGVTSIDSGYSDPYYGSTECITC